MKSKSLLAALWAFSFEAVAIKCTTNAALEVAEALKPLATPFCSNFLKNTQTRLAGLPGPLGAHVSLPAELSSVCSCLLSTTTVSPSTTCAACPSCTSVSISTVTQTLINSVTITGPGSVVTSVVTSTSDVTDTVISTSDVTVTSTSDVTITSTIASPTTVTVTVTAAATSTTITVTSTTTVAPSTETVDQHGCPAVDGDTIDDYVIHCASGAGSGSFAAATNPGYNIQDCSSQCFDNPDNIDCLGVTYTPPSGGAFNIIDGHLVAGTCTFYEFVTAPVAAAAGNVLAVFDNTFAG